MLLEYDTFQAFPIVEGGETQTPTLKGALSRTVMHSLVLFKQGEMDRYAQEMLPEASRQQGESLALSRWMVRLREIGSPLARSLSRTSSPRMQSQSDHPLQHQESGDGDADRDGDADNGESAGVRVEEHENGNEGASSAPPRWSDIIDIMGEDERIGPPPIILGDGKMVDKSPFVVNSDTPMAKVHLFFTMLGLNVIYVCQYGKLVGIITKKDLINLKISK